MLKQFVKIISIGTILGLIVYFGVFGYALLKSELETVELKNETNGETIFLLKRTWGYGDSKIAIGLNKKLKKGFGKSPSDKYYENVSTDYIYYKFENGKLYIYNENFEVPVENEFKTEIVFIGLTNPEFIKLKQDRNFEKRGLSIFPIR